MEEEEQQQKHWKSAQSVGLGLDLIAAAQSQLRFLAAVHHHPHHLYHGPALRRAIRRYENYWLPLLAEHGTYSSTGLPLIPPLDCAWIWHCHRLNPVQYIKDCKSSYGKLLDARNTFADTDSEAVAYTQQLWNAQFPGEKYEIDLDDVPHSEDDSPNKINYDLQAAVNRQSSFFYQVSRPHMGEESFLKAALQRYKGFLYLLKLSGLRFFLVPTYDIDLMWHSHQASPGVYQEDTVKLLGRVLNHDDTDSDRTEGKKLDTGFNRTREIWQRTFGSSYERAGAMYRGESPALLRPFSSTQAVTYSVGNCPRTMSGQSVPGVQARKTMEVFITLQRARNLHTSHESMLAVRILFKNKCSMLELETPWIKGAHNPEWNDFWAFQCEEATGGIRLELRSRDLTCCNLVTTSRLIGWVDFSWQTLLNSPTLSWDGWVPLQMKSKLEYDQKPTSLRISASITPPIAAPFLLRIEPSLLSKRKKGCLSKIVYDHRNKKSFTVKVSGSQVVDSFLPSLIQIFQNGYADATDNGISPVGLLGIAKRLSSDDTVPAMMMWSLLDGNMQLAISSFSSQDCQPNVQVKASPGDFVRLLHGRKCQYEVAGATEADEIGFMTLVRRTPDASFGKATALFNWKSGAMEILPEESGVLVLLLCTIIALSVNTTQHLTTLCKMKRSLQNLKRAISCDEWGPVVLNRHIHFCAQGLIRFHPWYSMSSDLWMSAFYDLGSGCRGVWAQSCCELGGGCGTCGGGGCGGCGAGGCGNRLRASGKGGGGGCGGCGAGGCGNSTTSV
eukprot:c23794_g1_i1 orf=101-2452(+)